MKCIKCSKKQVYNDLCKEHFIKYFEKKVYDTISKYRLINRGEKILVAASGGKDSTAILYLLNKKYKVSALAIDEGIRGYRDKTLEDLKKFCSQYKIPLKIVSYKEEIGYELDEILKIIDIKPCSACGVFRRYYLNKEKDFDILATGHNMDDELQSVFMNLFKNQPSMNARLGPRTGVVESKKFVQRIKPLYFCGEKEVAVYTYLMGFDISYNECPNSINSFRADVRDMILTIENKFPSFRENILDNFVRVLPRLKIDSKSESLFGLGVGSCSRCGEASNISVCNACSLKERIKREVLLKNKKIPVLGG